METEEIQRIETETKQLFNNLYNKEEIDKYNDILSRLAKEIEQVNQQEEKAEQLLDDLRDEDDNKKQTTQEIIKNIQREIALLKEKREKIIKEVLGQLYKGCIGGISFRKGEIFAYKSQWHPTLEKIKDEISNNLHTFAERISKTNPKNLDTFEFLYQKITEIVENREEEKEKTKIKLTEFKLPKTHYIVKENYMNTLTLMPIGYITINNGSFDFLSPEKNSIYTSKVSETRLLSYYQEELKELTKDYLKGLEDKRRILKEDIDNIKENCKDILMLLSLKENN